MFSIIIKNKEQQCMPDIFTNSSKITVAKLTVKFIRKQNVLQKCIGGHYYAEHETVPGFNGRDQSFYIYHSTRLFTLFTIYFSKLIVPDLVITPYFSLTPNYTLV